MSEDEAAILKFTSRGMMRAESMTCTGTEIDIAFTGRDGHTFVMDICAQQEKPCTVSAPHTHRGLTMWGKIR